MLLRSGLDIAVMLLTSLVVLRYVGRNDGDDIQHVGHEGSVD